MIMVYKLIFVHMDIVSLIVDSIHAYARCFSSKLFNIVYSNVFYLKAIIMTHLYYEVPIIGHVYHVTFL